MCTCVEGQREKRKSALLFMLTAQRHDSHCTETENSLGVVLYTENEGNKPTPMWGSFPALPLLSNIDVFEGFYLL